MENLDRLWEQTLSMLISYGVTPSRLGPTKEIVAYQGRLYNLFGNVVFNRVRKFSLQYACAEMLWYLSGEDSVERVAKYAPSYMKYTEGGIAYGAYGKRWKMGQQLERVIDILKNDPDSRQAIMTMFRMEDLPIIQAKAAKDIPCTLSLQFLVRNNRVHLITTMRSNDCWLGFPYDVFCFTTLQRMVADICGYLYGTYIHQSGSEHLYQKDWDRAVEALRIGSVVPTVRIPQQYIFQDWEEQIKSALQLDLNSSDKDIKTLHPILHDLVLGTLPGRDIPFYNPHYNEFVYREKNYVKK